MKRFDFLKKLLIAPVAAVIVVKAMAEPTGTAIKVDGEFKWLDYEEYKFMMKWKNGDNLAPFRSPNPKTYLYTGKL